MKLFAISKGVADLEYPIVGKTNDVAWPCLVDSALTLCHKLRWRRKSHSLSLTHMEIWLVTLELATAHFAEGDA